MGLYEYLHEFDAYDSLIITLESIQEVVAYANYQEKQSERAADISFLFEDADPEEVKTNVNKNIFEKIGAKIRELVEKLKQFGQWVADKIADIIPGMKSDAEKANQILKDNPELRDQIILAYREGDMTLKDIAGLEKDVEAVMRLYEAGKIDEDTTTGKIRSAIDKFNKSGEVILKTAGTIAGLLTIVGTFTAAVVKMKKSNKEFQEIVESYRRNLERIRVKNPKGSKVGSVFSALAQALGFASEEVKSKISMSQKIKYSIGKFVARMSKDVTKIDPTSPKSTIRSVDALIDAKNKKLKDKETLPSKKSSLEEDIKLLKTLRAFVKRTGELPTSDNTDATKSVTEVNKVLEMMKAGQTPTEIRDNSRRSKENEKKERETADIRYQIRKEQKEKEKKEREAEEAKKKNDESNDSNSDNNSGEKSGSKGGRKGQGKNNK